ncbi:urease accessory protein UreE [Opitutaceae bacterium EW11]|nr:urease accessory protein UreE [Opitutaceae bacterium EW11]
MLHLVHAPVERPTPGLPAVVLWTDRQHLSKRIWRGTADDGVAFGFDLQQPMAPGTTFFETGDKRYFVDQVSEPVLEISLEMTACAAAGVGWAVGNLHLELMGEAGRLLTPDSKAARQLCERLRIPYRAVSVVFRPGRFVRGAIAGAAVQELGSSHQHGEPAERPES